MSSLWDGGNQGGVGVDTDDIEHGGEERVLVFTVAVLIGENFGGGVRLVAAEAEGEADVANIFRDVGVECLDLFGIGCEVLGECESFCAEFGSGGESAFFEIGVPTGYVIPSGEGA